MKLIFKIRQCEGSWYVNAYFRGRIVMTSAWSHRRFESREAVAAWCARVGIKVGA